MRRDPRALSQRGELRPHHDRMNSRRYPSDRGEATVGAGDDVLTADESAELHDPLCDEVGVFDEVRRRVDDPRNENFAVREANISPELPLMGMARVRRLDRIGLRTDVEDQIDDPIEGDVERVRSLVVAPADVVAD